MEEPTDEVCDKCGKPMVIKWGRYGKFLACSGYPECKNTRQLAGGEGDGGPEVHEDVAKRGLPQGRAAHGAQEGPLRSVPGLHATIPNARTTRRLVRGEGGKLQVERLAPIDEKCPDCGSDLMWRRGRFGAFIACSNYPTCKYIKKKEAREIGLLCPECGQGQVVERKGRWGRFFYGCRRYPECKFTAYHKPDRRALPRLRPRLPAREGDEEGRQGRLLRQRGVPLQARSGLTFRRERKRPTEDVKRVSR